MQICPSVTRTQSIEAFTKLPSRFYEAHGDRYTYNNLVFTGAIHPVTITCGIHGDFKQLAANHSNGAGCPKCAKVSQREKVLHYPAEAILKAASGCSSRGEFQTKFSHEYMAAVNRGIYEEVCKHMPDEYNKRKTTETFTEEVTSLVGTDYVVLGEYVNRKTKISLLHKACNTVYSVAPASFLRGRRCPACVTTGFNKGKPATLYYLVINVNGTLAYKVGITNNTVRERYSLTELQSIKILEEVHYDLGLYAYLKEQDILATYKQYKYTGKPLLRRGNTELFNEDIRNYYDFKAAIQN